MIKFNKINSDIFKLIKRLPDVFESEKRICLSYLFGSFAANKVNDLSDVDIAYLLEKGKEISFDEEMQLAERIVKALETDEIDLIQLNKAPVFFSYKIISTGSVIYCKEKKEKENFESKIFMEYLDMKPMIDTYFSQMLKHIKENR